MTWKLADWARSAAVNVRWQSARFSKISVKGDEPTASWEHGGVFCFI